MSATHPKPRPKAAGTMTYEKFLDWADEDTLAEWVDGRVIVTSPASVRHQRLKSFVAGIIGRFVRFHQLGTTLDAPFQMKLSRSGREPDVLFVANDHLGRLQPPAKPTYLDGPADLVVEVVSVPESETRDRQDKFAEYQQSGVPEYWILDPDNQRADFYQLDAQGVYQAVAPEAQDIYRSRTLPGLWLNVAWLWQDPLPDEEDIVATIIGKAYADYRRARLSQLGL